MSREHLTFQELNLTSPPSLYEWDQLVTGSPASSPYFLSDWIIGLNRYLRQDNIVYTAHLENRIIGGIVVSRFNKYGIHGVRRPFATPHCHPVLRTGYQPTVRNDIASDFIRFLLTRHHLVQLTFSYVDDLPAQLIVKPQESTQKSTYLLSIDDSDSLWRGFDPRLRNKIRKAQKMGVKVRIVQQAEAFSHLYLRMFDCLKKPLAIPREQFCVFCEHLIQSGLGSLYEARDEKGQLHAARLILSDERVAFDALAASDPQLRKSGASALLLWEIFNQGLLRAPLFDMAGANLVGIARFKERFNGKLVHYNQNCYYRNWIVHIGALLHRNMRRLRLRLAP